LRYNIIADGVANIRMAARRRPLFQNLRVAGVVIRINQEDLGCFILLGFAAVRRIIAVCLDPYAGVVVGIFDNRIRGARIIGGDPPQAVLEVILVGDFLYVVGVRIGLVLGGCDLLYDKAVLVVF